MPQRRISEIPPALNLLLRVRPLLWIAALASTLAWLSWARGAATLLLAQDAAVPADTLADEPLPEPGGSAPLPAAPVSGQRQTLLDTIKAGGFIGLLIALSSIVAVAFAVEHVLTIRKPVIMPERVAKELEDRITAGRIDDAIDTCLAAENYSLISEVVLAGLQRYKSSEFGFAEYKAAIEEAGEEQTARLYRKTEVLAVVGTIAPMLGLLGTVQGMISAFNTIAATGGMARPHQLAGGISLALVTTLMGLIVAIPAMIAFSYFRNRIDSLVAEAGKRVEQITMPLGRRR